MMIKCALCSYEFDPQAGYKCKACPLTSACNLIACPNCGYHHIGESKTTSILKKLFRVKEKVSIAGCEKE